MDPQARPFRKPLPVHHVPDADSGYVFDPAQQTLVGLNPVGEGIWELCDGETTVAEIAGELADHFGRTPAEVIGDVTAFLADLARHQLIELR